MPIIENFATVRYTSGGSAATSVSNVAQSELTASVLFNKSSLGENYSADSTVTYILSLSNTAATPLNGITVTDNLGTFEENGNTYTPLTYAGPALLLVDGQDVTPNLTVDATNPDSLIFTIPRLPP